MGGGRREENENRATSSELERERESTVGRRKETDGGTNRKID